jgi:oligopeptide/dipeptide ABC transporter ATP-binding protein
MTKIVLDVKDLSLSFTTGESIVSILQEINLKIYEGEVVGLVGESGSGKSVTALAISKLLPENITHFTNGSINFDGINILDSSEQEVAKLRGRRIGFVFQEPMTALNPTMTIGNQLFHVIRRHSNLSKSESRVQVRKSLEEVLIANPEIVENYYPFQLSGGMRQRVVIAMAMSANPSLLIADEPTTALDVTVQAEILSLITKLAQNHGTAVLLISHDLGVIANTCSKVTVMYAGEVVENGAVADVLKSPKHPYTQALIKSLPDIATRGSILETISGEFPDLRNRPAGCIYSPRCDKKFDKCVISPELVSLENDQQVACWLVEK